MPGPFDKAAGMLRGSSKSVENSSSDAEIKNSRTRQALAEKNRDKAMRKGDKVLGDAYHSQVADEMKSRTKMHQTKKILPSYKEGGVVEETGPALLHEGEIVVPNRVSAVLGGNSASKTVNELMPEVESVTIRKSDNGGFIVEHELAGGAKSGAGKKSKRIVLMDPTALHTHLDEVFGIEEEPESPEPEVEAAEEEGELEGMGEEAEPPEMGDAAATETEDQALADELEAPPAEPIEGV